MIRGPQHVRFLSVRSKLQQIHKLEKVAGSVNSAKSAHLSNKWTPELESTCDLGSKTLFPTRSFAPEHRFAFDSRVPASSCVQYSRTAKLLVIAQVRCSRANEHVEKSLLGRKCYRDSNFAIYFSFQGPEHVRFFSVRSKLQQIRWK